MEGMESASVTPETSAGDSGSDASGDIEGGDQEQTTQATSGKAKAPAKAPTIKELGDADLDAVVTLKINGQTKKVPVREAIKLAQLEQASHAKMQEAAKIKSQAEQLMAYAKQNPKDFLKQTGVDPYEFAEMTLAEQLELMQMSPEQKRLMEAEQKLKTYEEREKKAQEEAEAKKNADAEAKYMQDLDKEIGDAFKASNLPKHPYYVQQIAAVMLSASKQGQELTAEKAAAIVKNRFNQHTRELLDGLDANAILELLGEAGSKKLREAEIAKVTAKAAPTANSVQRPGLEPQAVAQKPKKSMTTSEWRAWQESLKNSNA